MYRGDCETIKKIICTNFEVIFTQHNSLVDCWMQHIRMQHLRMQHIRMQHLRMQHIRMQQILILKSEIGAP